MFDTRALSDTAATDLRTAVAAVPGVEVEAPKALVLDDAEREGAGLTEVFSMIGIFSVLAGILLLINLFVMLAEERKTELGMLRAVGFTRRRLTRAFAIEGEVPNPDGKLKPGTFARVQITTDRVERAVTIPVAAVQSRYGTNRVFVVKDGQIAGREVVLGDRLGDRVKSARASKPARP